MALPFLSSFFLHFPLFWLPSPHFVSLLLLYPPAYGLHIRSCVLIVFFHILIQVPPHAVVVGTLIVPEDGDDVSYNLFFVLPSF